MRTPSRLRPGVVLLGAVTAVVLAGCSGDDSAAGEAPPAEEVPDAEFVGPDAAEEPGTVGGDDQAIDDSRASEDQDVPPDIEDGTAGRDLVFRASITLASDTPDVTAAEVRSLAAEAGGFVSEAQLQRNDLGLLAGSITIRVPSDGLEVLLGHVSDIGADVVAEQRTTEDVTGQLTDIDARLRNLEALEEELLVVLAEARTQGDVEDVVTVFDRVADVRGQIEVLEGRRAGLADLVALSTLTVFVEPSRAAVAAASQVPEADRPLPWSPGNEAASAWDDTVAATRTFVDGVIRLVVYVLPVVLLWVLPVALLALLARRLWRRRDVAGPGSGTPVEPPPAPRRPDVAAESDTSPRAVTTPGREATTATDDEREPAGV